MSNIFLALASLTLMTGPAFATKNPSQTEFIEAREKKLTGAMFSNLADDPEKAQDQIAGEKSLIESTKLLYRNFQDRVRVPGFISSSPLPQLAKIIGPNRTDSLFRTGDTLFIRWSGNPMPRPGERFSSFTPAIVLQNVMDPSDFQIKLAPEDFRDIPKDFRLAGYFYEATSRLKVIRVKSNLVEAIVEQMTGTVGVGDELMPLPPLQEKLSPVQGGLQLSAAVVSGSPHNRLSTTERSYLYINRGTRDGIRVGQIFEAIESVRLDEAVYGTSPEQSAGEAMVIYATDAYSTAMITQQFDVIRIGSLLRTKQEMNPTPPMSPFEGYKVGNKKARTGAPGKPDESLPELPNMSNPQAATDPSLPEVPQKTAAPALSELDALEKSLKLKDLSPEEKLKLGRLSQQEKIGVEKGNIEDTGEEEKMESAPIENSFKGKKDAKKDKKKKKGKGNEEEELNLLMQQN